MTTDQFGRTITDHGDGVYSVDGVVIANSDLDSARRAFDAMAPPGWGPPTTTDDRDPVALLAALIVEAGVATIETVAAAIGQTPEQVRAALDNQQ